MSEHLLKTIADLEDDLHAAERKVVGLKTTINYLCERAGIAPKFEVADAPLARSTQSASVEPDRYHGKSLNGAVVDYLQRRKHMNANAGPASAEEIHATLIAGGYTGFDKSRKEDQLHSLKTSLGKSSHTFSRLPNGTYGLVEWYPHLPRKKKKVTDASAGSDSALNGDSDDAAIAEGVAEEEK